MILSLCQVKQRLHIINTDYADHRRAQYVVMTHKGNDKHYTYEHIVQDINTKHLTQHKWLRNRRLHYAPLGNGAKYCTNEYKIDST